MYLPVGWPVVDLVARQAARTPERTALVDAESGATWTYRELSAGPIAGLAGALVAAGVGPGDRVGTVTEPGARFAQLVHATARAGACLVPFPPDAPPTQLAARAEAAAVDALVVGPAAEPDWFDGPTLDVDDAGPGPAGEPARWDPDDVQWLVFTSGTTGEPQAVELTARNLVASATGSALRLGVAPEDRWLACLPMHHVGGLAPLVRSALYGTAAVTTRGFDAAAVAAAVDDHGVTAISLVPTMLSRLLDRGWSPPASLRFVLLGGAPASEALLRRCAERDVPVCPTYGATETASQVATARPEEAVDHPGTVGRPIPGTTVEIRRPDGGPAADGEPGELVVSGPAVSPGYIDGAATAARFGDGWFRTRDRGHRDGAGRLWVVGRVDDAIVTGGETVQPAAVEAALLEHPAVSAAAVVGLEDDEWGEVVGALVVPAAGTTDEAALVAHCRARLATHAVPRVLAAAASLPRTPSGTVERESVRARLRAARSGRL